MSQITENLSTSRRNMTDLAAKLRAEAASNPTFKAICETFAKRERARNQVTLANLAITMEREGFEYTREQYATALKTLASLGVGRLEQTRKGKQVVLKDIKVTLQSLGKVATSKADSLRNFKQRNSFSDILPPKQATAVEPVPVETTTLKLAIAEASYPVSLVATINGERVSFPLPFNLTGAQICDAVRSIQPAGGLPK